MDAFVRLRFTAARAWSYRQSPPMAISTRFWSKVVKGEPDACWPVDLLTTNHRGKAGCGGSGSRLRPALELGLFPCTTRRHSEDGLDHRCANQMARRVHTVSKESLEFRQVDGTEP